MRPGSIDAPDVKEFAANILEGRQGGLYAPPRKVRIVGPSGFIKLALASACRCRQEIIELFRGNVFLSHLPRTHLALFRRHRHPLPKLCDPVNAVTPSCQKGSPPLAMTRFVGLTSFMKSPRAARGESLICVSDLRDHLSGVKRQRPIWRGFSEKSGGEGGIRTPDTVSRIPVFKTGAINHSATSPTTTVLLQCGSYDLDEIKFPSCSQVITNLRPRPSPVFKTGAINHSANSPHL